jgi:hypothetical protein
MITPLAIFFLIQTSPVTTAAAAPRDEEVIRNLELLENYELLDQLDVIDDLDVVAGEGDDR